jgi:hypothetical protein
MSDAMPAAGNVNVGRRRPLNGLFQFDQKAAVDVDRWMDNTVLGSLMTAKPVPNGLTASATRITSKTTASSSFRKNTHENWQDDAWAMYDLVGEQRFLANTLSQRASKAKFYVGQISDIQGETPIAINDPSISGILGAIGDGLVGLQQLVQRLVLNLFITGDGWLVGIPKEMMPGAQESAATIGSPAPQLVNRNGNLGKLGPNEYTLPTLDALEWRMLSVSECKFTNEGQVILHLGPTEPEKLTVDPDQVYLIRIWRPHPRHWWQADSPTRSSLAVLRELVGLTMHISAQVDSRLAGAGLLIVPQSAAAALKRAAGMQDDDPSDPFTEALIQAMLTPIGDRSNASALVPLVITVPDEAAEHFHHMTFDKPLDTEARPLRDEAIRRLALGQDAPPELLLGSGGMNHWGAWLVQEEVVSAHIEPPIALICDALTGQYLRPILIANGMTPEDAEKYVIWYDVSHLIIRPNRAADAKELFKDGVLSDEALRKANGFEEDDAPSEKTDDPAIMAAFEMVKHAPGLMLRPGLNVILEQLRALLSGSPLGAIDNADDTRAHGSIAGPGGLEDRSEEDDVQVISRPLPNRPVTSVAKPTSAPASAPTPTPAPGAPPATSAAPAPIPPTASPVADATTAGVGQYASARDLGLRGTLSKELNPLADDDIVDLTQMPL